MPAPKNPPEKHLSYAKGESSTNIAGRPLSLQVLRDLARANTVEAMQTVLEIMKDPDTPAAVRLKAADMIWERGHGRPVEAVVLENVGAVRDPRSVSQPIMDRIDWLLENEPKLVEHFLGCKVRDLDNPLQLKHVNPDGTIKS